VSARFFQKRHFHTAGVYNSNRNRFTVKNLIELVAPPVPLRKEISVLLKISERFIWTCQARGHSLSVGDMVDYAQNN